MLLTIHMASYASCRWEFQSSVKTLPLVGQDAKFAYELSWQQIVALGSRCPLPAGREIGTCWLKVNMSPLPAYAGGD